jgi:hypothetical protein
MHNVIKLLVLLLLVSPLFGADNRVLPAAPALSTPSSGYSGLSASYFTADSIQITITSCSMSDGNTCKEFKDVAVTASLGASVGPGGPDIATLDSASRWLYYWTIGKPDGTVAGLLSATCGLTTSSYSPVMPADYSFKRCLGAGS